jgi:hypothetical protein
MTRRDKGVSSWATRFLTRTAHFAIAAAVSVCLPATAQSKKPALDLEKAVGVLELRIQMAENSLKFVNNTANLTELISALEDYLNGKCFGDLFKTLDYKGPPTDPTCVAYMDRLFQLNPDNPAATCLRDGISAQSCADAYQNQKTVIYYSGAHDTEMRSSALKAGIPAAEIERLSKLTLTLKEVNSKYQSTEDLDEKSRLMDDALALYDQMLGTACRITAVKFAPRPDARSSSEDREIREAREKLLKIPPNIRADHQERMISEVETRFAAVKDNKTEQARLLALMEAIKNPSGEGTMTIKTNERVRLILPQCKELISQCLAAFPKAPAPICHQDGWLTPNCMRAIRLYRAERQQRTVAAQATQQATNGETAPPPASQPPNFSKF